MIINTILEIIAVLALLYGFYREDDIIAWERSAWKQICEIINRWIRVYERRRAR